MGDFKAPIGRYINQKLCAALAASADRNGPGRLAGNETCKLVMYNPIWCLLVRVPRLFFYTFIERRGGKTKKNKGLGALQVGSH